ncbi:Carboxymuconolactone decarboxylase family protein [Thalassoglobus neptunius]|uniref:Carboxymuconolactone decarboxylase family protein n=1 Tax=Thalassoglobus neptunius TaxID=1938619 RepID=A0A5C5X472_9PLAN|nr:carboxymuconolactone decarboxylase family protein [Thalassoglobus neptunius]TWT57670.1 Carboxymuconolactone decarboxylase family protein [Thalassoglobus neptunius]
MPRIKAINPKQATGEAKQLLADVKDKFGVVSNLARTLANSPAALKGYLALGEAMEGSLLPAKLREQIALTVSESNGCNYCVAAHCAIGKTVGLSDNELTDARQSSSPDTKVDVALRLAKQLVEDRGWVSNEALNRVRRAGYGDGEIAEIVAIVAWKTFANYFNQVAGTDVDFPAAPEAR